MKTYMKCPNPLGRYQDAAGEKFALLEVNPLSNIIIGTNPTFEAETKAEAAVSAELTFLGAPDPVSFNCPPHITQRQLRITLHKNNISIESIEAIINGFNNENKKAKALIGWQYANHFDRSSELLIEVATALGLSKSDINQIFKDGAKE
jgi:hypothetical protein